MTAHNHAKKGEIAKVVLMPGDPLRAKWIAEEMLQNPRLVNDIRGMYCYTGQYKGKEVSVMAHGMGIPSIGIYSYELFKFYDVDAIIRIGSTGAYVESVKVNDVVLVDEAFSDSDYAQLINTPVNNKTLYPSKALNDLILKTANSNNIPIKSVRCHSSDAFYDDRSLAEIVNYTKSEVVDMEAFGLFANANKLNKQAATLLTCSDSLVTHEQLSADARRNTFKNMVILALETAIQLI